MNRDLRELVLGFFDRASAKLAETNESQTAESLAELFVEQASKALGNPETKASIARMLEPLAQDWLDGKIERD